MSDQGDGGGATAAPPQTTPRGAATPPMPENAIPRETSIGWRESAVGPRHPCYALIAIGAVAWAVLALALALAGFAPYWPLTKPIAASWAIGPPAFFFVEHLIRTKLGTADQDFARLQELAAKIWLGVSGVLFFILK